jgi:hypothetical protein
MKRVLALLVALAAGIVLSGIGAGLLIPQLPADYRSPGIVALSSAILIAVCVGVAFAATRTPRS